MAVKARAEITLSSIRDVQSVTRYYLLQSSTSAVPSKPTTNPPGGNWVTSEPTYTSGSTNSLYFVDLTVFSDGTFAYSGVSLSSSYEAAKVAYNKAASAEDVANSASDKVDNLQIGGRNLWKNTGTPSILTARNTGGAADNYNYARIPYVNSINLKQRDTYTISGFVSFTSVDESQYPIPTRMSVFLSTDPDYYPSGTFPINTDGSFSYTFTIQTNTEGAHQSILYAGIAGSTRGIGATFSKLKLERGTLATDWTPAPEDIIEAGISAANEAVDGLQIGGRNLVRRTDYSIYGNSNNYTNANQAIFSSGRITIPFGKEVYQNKYTRNELKTPIPKGTKIIMSVYVYEQTVPDGHHRLYVSGLRSNGSVNWNHHFKAIPYDFVGKFTWEHTTPEDFYGFVLEFDTRSGTSGQMVLGPVKAEIGTLATDWTPAPEDLENAITTSQKTADGKNTVYYQNSAPTNQTFKVNDIWFDTDDENKMYHWNGSAWTAAPFGNAAFSNIDAGKVTTGTMSASRIKGDTLTLGGENNVDGMLKVYDANGTLVGSFTREGLMAIAGTIGGWIINSSELTGEWQETYKHFESLLSPVSGLQFEETSTEPGFDAQFLNSIWYGTAGISFLRRRTVNNAVEQLSAFISADTNGGWDGSGREGQITISPHLRVDGTGIDTPYMRADASYAWDVASGSYIRQPAMIMAGSTTISTGASSKRATICTIPTEYQTGWRIIPFVTRTYGNPGATPADAGDFYYAYYNSVDHEVCIKLANALVSGIPYIFDYMIYAVPTT